MKSFFSKTYIELFVALTLFSLILTLIEIFGFSLSNNSSLWVLIKSLVISLFMIITLLFFIFILIINYFILRKNEKNAICDLIASVLLVYIVLLFINSVLYFIKIITALTGT